MSDDNELLKQIEQAKCDMHCADQMIRNYIPFIKSETSKFLSRTCLDEDDEFSIAMIAFHEAIRGYQSKRGAFLKYAAMVIKSRLIDYSRKEQRHKGHVSLDEAVGNNGKLLKDNLTDNIDYYEQALTLEATKQEIAELSGVMAQFGVRFCDVSENSPKQKRTVEACQAAIRYASQNKELLDELLETKKLPLAKLVLGTGVERKTLERHRKYILVMLLIQTNGYEIIREHLKPMLVVKGGERT